MTPLYLPPYINPAPMSQSHLNRLFAKLKAILRKVGARTVDEPLAGNWKRCELDEFSLVGNRWICRGSVRTTSAGSMQVGYCRS